MFDTPLRYEVPNRKRPSGEKTKLAGELPANS